MWRVIGDVRAAQKSSLGAIDQRVEAAGSDGACKNGPERSRGSRDGELCEQVHLGRKRAAKVGFDKFGVRMASDLDRRAKSQQALRQALVPKGVLDCKRQ